MAQILPCAALAVPLHSATATTAAYAEHAIWRTPAAWVEAQYQPDDGIVCVPTEWCSVPLSAYLETVLSGSAHLDPDSPDNIVWGRYVVPDSAPYFMAYVHKLGTILLVAAINTPAADTSLLAATHSWLQTHCVAGGSIAARTVTVTRYIRCVPTLPRAS